MIVGQPLSARLAEFHKLEDFFDETGFGT